MADASDSRVVGQDSKMMPELRNFVLFQTDLFVYHQRDVDIDRWFVGGDCAGWFYMRLLLMDRIQPDREPVMEDWGWTFAVSAREIRVRVNVWSYSIDNCWIFGLETKPTLMQRISSKLTLQAKGIVANAIERIITTEPRINKHVWSSENPWDTGIERF